MKDNVIIEVKKLNKKFGDLHVLKDISTDIKKGDYKLYYSKGEYELYQIRQDPGEQNNIAATEPERVAALDAIMRATYQEFKESFEGAEYGTQSYDRVKQEWRDVMKID